MDDLASKIKQYCIKTLRNELNEDELTDFLLTLKRFFYPFAKRYYNRFLYYEGYTVNDILLGSFAIIFSQNELGQFPWFKNTFSPYEIESLKEEDFLEIFLPRLRKIIKQQIHEITISIDPQSFKIRRELLICIRRHPDLKIKTIDGDTIVYKNSNLRLDRKPISLDELLSLSMTMKIASAQMPKIVSTLLNQVELCTEYRNFFSLQEIISIYKNLLELNLRYEAKTDFEKSFKEEIKFDFERVLQSTKNLIENKISRYIEEKKVLSLLWKKIIPLC
ncbi:MAG: hypothetical protein AB1410_06295 [Acidobacteriota bacterium]